MAGTADDLSTPLGQTTRRRKRHFRPPLTALQALAVMLGLFLASFAGFAVFMLGIAIVYTDLLRRGGWPQVGAIVAIMGVIDGFFAPRLLKKAWDEQDRARP